MLNSWIGQQLPLKFKLITEKRTDKWYKINLIQSFVVNLRAKPTEITHMATYLWQIIRICDLAGAKGSVPVPVRCVKQTLSLLRMKTGGVGGIPSPITLDHFNHNLQARNRAEGSARKELEFSFHEPLFHDALLLISGVKALGSFEHRPALVFHDAWGMTPVQYSRSLDRAFLQNQGPVQGVVATRGHGGPVLSCLVSDDEKTSMSQVTFCLCSLSIMKLMF